MAQSKIQRQGVKTDTELTGAGGVIADLINDNQIYLAGNSINKTLKQAIIDGDLSGSGKTQSNELSNLGLSATVGASALTIALKTKDGNNPSGGSSVVVGFRSSTLGSGQFTTVSISSALSTVISSGSTAGQLNATSAYIYVYLINNAGTAELAWSRLLYDEGSLITTTAEGGAGGADSANTIYSTTARTNVPLRLIGRLLNTQATAGTWATNPSEISLVPFEKQVITLIATQNSGQALGAGAGIIYNNRVVDTHSAYNTSNGQFTAPEDGIYEMSAEFRTQNINVAAGNSIALVANNLTTGVLNLGPLDFSYAAVTRQYSGNVTALVSASKGDQLRIRLTGSIVAGNFEVSTANNYLNITKIRDL